MNQENIGKFLASLRKENNLTQEQFAERLGVNSRSISRWENGNCMPDLSLLPVIAKEMGVSVEELLNGKRQNAGKILPRKNTELKNYELLQEINRKLICGIDISDEEKQNVVVTFLNGISSSEDCKKYKMRMGVNVDADDIYPHYFLPPYNGNKKLRLIQGYLPKTNILYANHYELEVIRLLFLFAPEHEKVKELVNKTIDRLKNTCFGNSCMQGECLATGISVLRFLAMVQPDNTSWQEQLVNPLGDIFLACGSGQALNQNGIPLTYLLMAFADIGNDKIRYVIEQKKDWLLELLRKGWITGKVSKGKLSEGDGYNLLSKFIIRNAIGMLPEYQDVCKYEIYVDDTSGRCYCRI